jgi:RNA polymerase sigma-B factor
VGEYDAAVGVDFPPKPPFEPGSEDGATPLESIGHEDEALEGVENREAINRILATLPDRERRIIVLRFFRGMTQSQIADEVGISQMHVSRLLSRTLAHLRAALITEPGSPMH